jgi:hypothetical protein
MQGPFRLKTNAKWKKFIGEAHAFEPFSPYRANPIPYDDFLRIGRWISSAADFLYRGNSLRR